MISNTRGTNENCLVFLSLIATALAKTHPADLVLKNANIYTVDEHKPRAQAIAVKNREILFVGSDAEVQQYIGANTRVLDLEAATVVPSFTDSHYHFLASVPANSGSIWKTQTVSINCSRD